jgi:hypothetical protein
MKKFLKIIPAVLLLAIGLSFTTNTWSKEQKLSRKEKKEARQQEYRYQDSLYFTVESSEQ